MAGPQVPNRSTIEVPYNINTVPRRVCGVACGVPWHTLQECKTDTVCAQSIQSTMGATKIPNPTLTTVPMAMPNFACCHIWKRFACLDVFWNCSDILERAEAFSPRSSNLSCRSSSSSMLDSINFFTSSTSAATVAVCACEIACCICCCNVGPNERCAASVPPVRHAAVGRSGAVRSTSFSTYALARASDSRASYTQLIAKTTSPPGNGPATQELLPSTRS
mmetsp:Transcript_41556/g.93907  ORF Transcript_41556/g.93907 Transcript_41556/m.93907 type:complete len:221 (-) Transcript_41556:130-792(-)